MNGMLDNHELARQLAVLEERMNTMDERYDKNWALLREDMAKRDVEAAKRDVEAAKRDVEAARRDKANVQWLVGMILGAAVLIIAVLGLMIRFPPAATGG